MTSLFALLFIATAFHFLIRMLTCEDFPSLYKVFTTIALILLYLVGAGLLYTTILIDMGS